MNARIGLFLALILAALHFGLAIVYAQITPYRQPGVLMSYGHSWAKDIGAPDERQHANYVQHLLDGNGFPVLGDPAADAYENYQAHQPPLYYLLAAGWSKITGAAPDDPDHGRPLRWLNCLIGGATVVGVYFLGFWGLKRPEVGVIGAAFVGLLPMNLALSGAASNDPLLIGLCTWALALCALAVREGWNWRLALIAGGLTGLAVLTKTTALALFPALLVAALVPQINKPTVGMAAATALIALIIPLPWLARNQSLYGDPFALSAFQKAFTGNPTPDTFIEPLEQLGQSPIEARFTYWGPGVAWWTARSFLGVFGYMDIWLTENGSADDFPGLSKRLAQPNWVYRIFLAVIVLLFFGWALATFSPAYREDRSVQIVNVAFSFVVLALFIRFNMQYFQAQARYLFPALGPIGIGVGIGSLRLLKNRWTPVLAGTCLMLLAVNILVISRFPEAVRQRTAEGIGSRQN